MPLYYDDIHITNPASLKRFIELLQIADQKWDSIRRIPYSAPGRWVHTLNLGHMKFCLWEEACQVDALLTQLFPLTPFLKRFVLNNAITLSRRAIDSFSYRDGTQNLRFLKGVKLLSSPLSEFAEDPFMDVLRNSINLEELSIIGSGVEAIQLSSPIVAEEPDAVQIKPLGLPRLRKLSLLSMHSSSIMLSLLHSPLPSLNHLTVTPYDDISIPSSLVPRFINAHGRKLGSLHLYTHKSWPTMLFPSPTTLLHTCPQLRHLSLENPLPTLTVCSIYPRHPLQILSIPRPNPEFLSVLETLLPKLPSLGAIRTRDVRWVRRGLSSRALEAGVQGEMREWRRRLGRRGIQVVDADWKHCTD